MAKKKVFNAQAARELTQKNAASGVPDLQEHIEKAAEEGGSSCRIAASSIPGGSEANIKEIKALGFKATYYIDLRDGDYYEIAW